MKVVDLLERRRQNWQELERYCDQLQGASSAPKLPPASMSRFGALYRAACADLALAHAYQLPQNTVQYLHRLVGRAHNQLYRSRRFEFKKWGDMLLYDVPQRVFNDRCVQLMFVVFWGLFILAAWLAYSKAAWPDFAEQVISPEQISAMEENFKSPIDGSQRSGDDNTVMASFYLDHNSSIGLQCFAWGLLVVPGMLVSMYNAIFLGACFGYMARPEVFDGPGGNFFHFVTAHGPFELTAIVLSAGSGLRLGLSWMMPGDLTRYDNLRKTGREMMPVMGAALVMFFMAALIEGFLSPSAAWYSVKATVAIVSSGLLAFYFLVLGFPRRLL
ncbi:MAG: stage II sporulation protein M [Pirellulaceae bacterium]